MSFLSLMRELIRCLHNFKGESQYMYKCVYVCVRIHTHMHTVRNAEMKLLMSKGNVEYWA